MAIRGEDDTSSKLQDFKIGSSWIPETPTKPGPTNQQPICANWQQDSPAQPNWLEAERCTPASQAAQVNVCEPESITENFLQEFDNWQAGEAASSRVYGENSCTYDQFPINAAGQWTNMPFGKLLALAEANGNKTAIENTLTRHFATSGSSDSYFHQQTEGGQFTVSFEDSSQKDQGSLLRANFNAESKISNFETNGSSVPSRHFFDLNSPPRTNAGSALRKSTSSQFEPITPEKTNKESLMKDMGIIDEVPANKENEATTGVTEIHEKDTNQLCEATSTQLQENHKPDKGGTEEADLSKTPQQKTRRKKHRPKVIIEGQNKKTPKSSAEKPSVPQKTTRVKRSYVRKNGVNTPVGGTNGSDLDNKTPMSTETPLKRRKYTRKIINKPEDNMDKGTPETTNMKAPRRSQRSCRKSLNFNSDGLERDGSSTYCPSSNWDRESQAENFNAKDLPSAAPCIQEIGVMLRKNDMVNSHEVSHSMNQVQEDYLTKPELHYQSPSTSPNRNKNTLTDQIVCTRGKCQIVFSDVTHDKEANTVQVSMNPYGHLTAKSPSDSICSSTCLTPEKQERDLKRQSTCTTVEAELCNRNETGILYNSLQAYHTILFHNADKIDGTPGLHFPVIYKKKRTEKGHCTVTSSIQIKASTSDNHVHPEKQTSPTNQRSCGTRCQVNDLLSNGSQTGRQVFKDLLALGPTQRIRKRRSKGPTRPRDVALLLEELPTSPGKAATISRIKQHVEILHEPYTCMEALVADTRSTTIKKKRSKRSMPNNSTAQNLYNHQIFASVSMGPPLALTWKSMSAVDLIIEQLNQLDLNAENSRASETKYNSLMAYHRYYQEQHALVPFQNSAAIVPFDEVRRRQPRPKVDLDNETTRVWKLLLENINSEGIDGTDEEKTKWWEEERRVFRGRTDSFIARMHLIQGDRRFSPWKGSVVDSVVGVFLTQNVSDHLSSSAFMSLAARYPLKSETNPAELHEEGLDTKTNEPEICVLESDGTFVLNREILNQSVCGEDTKRIQNFKDDGITEVNSIKSSGNTCDGVILKDNLTGQPNDTPAHGPVTSCEIATTKSVSLTEDERDTEDTLSSQNPEISSQNSTDSPIAQTTERTDSYFLSTTEAVGVEENKVTNSGSFVKLLQMAGTVLHGVYERGSDKKTSTEYQHVQLESLASDLQVEDHLGNPTFPVKTMTSYTQSTLCHVPNSGVQATDFDLSQRKNNFSDSSSNKELCTAEISELSSESACGSTFQKMTAVSIEEVQKISSPNAHSSNNEQIEINKKIFGNQTDQVPVHFKLQGISNNPAYPQNLMDATGSTSNIVKSKNSEHKEVNSNKNDLDYHPGNTVNGSKAKGGRPRKEKENQVDWDHLRKQACVDGRERARTLNTLDSVDWDAVRHADVKEIAHTIRERGMNNMLAERIKAFLDRLVRDHGSIDLEWLRDVPPDKAKEYLLSIRGLGLKSVECVRLLTLHHLAFPVDTNVGRIAVRLGWVPLQPLPESLQLHLLELYPVLESIQKYLWPRLCKLDQRTLYELHYQMITFGKVFCTKSKPNCNACPMRGECRHFASAFASARLALPAPEDKSIVSATENRKADQNPFRSINTLQLPSTKAEELVPISGFSSSQPIIEEPSTPEPIVEVPDTPEPDHTQVPDIESAPNEDPDEIPTIQLNMEVFTHNLQAFIQQNTELQEGDMSKALVALTSAAASIPVPKLKNVSRLRTEHQVYELPDSHPLLEGMDKREPDDPCPYLLAIWTPGETMNSIEPPEQRCSSQEFEKLCSDETCLSCNSIRESNSQTVRGTLLIPCRTAMRGSFPLNGTYFQVNEVFSDHKSSLCPIDVPRKWLWNLPRRTVYFGTSIPTIFKGLSTEGIQYCFWRGFVCVRGFDRKTRAPRPLIARLHFPASRLAKGKGKIDENQ